jgi:hypothetical protein
LADQFPAFGEFFSTVTIAEEPVMPQTHETGRKDMKQKAANELAGIKGHQPDLVSSAIILPAEGDFAILELDETMIGDGHPMRIAAEVIQDLRRAAEGGLGVDNPVRLACASKKVTEDFWFRQAGKLASESQLLLVEGYFKVGEELSAE